MPQGHGQAPRAALLLVLRWGRARGVHTVESGPELGRGEPHLTGLMDQRNAAVCRHPPLSPLSSSAGGSKARQCEMTTRKLGSSALAILQTAWWPHRRQRCCSLHCARNSPRLAGEVGGWFLFTGRAPWEPNVPRPPTTGMQGHGCARGRPMLVPCNPKQPPRGSPPASLARSRRTPPPTLDEQLLHRGGGLHTPPGDFARRLGEP